jgi:hypothetical protein
VIFDPGESFSANSIASLPSFASLQNVEAVRGERGTNGASDKQAVIHHKDSLGSLSHPFGIAFFCALPGTRSSSIALLSFDDAS